MVYRHFCSMDQLCKRSMEGTRDQRQLWVVSKGSSLPGFQPNVGHTLQLLLIPRSPNSLAAFIFFLQGPPGLPGPPGPPGPPGAVVNIKGVSQDGARDRATDTRSASAGAGFPEGLTPHILSPTGCFPNTCPATLQNSSK